MVRTREVAMRSDRVLGTIDFHTAGIGMRLLTSGLERLPGSTIGEKRRWCQQHLDHLRTGLCLEPRGHRALLIAVMTEPVTPDARFGLFFIYPGGYYVSCGEGTIGAATVAIETGMVPRQGPETRILVDTEAGPVETIARWEDERGGEGTLKWTPSFVALADQVVEVEGVGEGPLDIAVGVGNVFAVVQAPHVGVAIRREHVKRIAQRGMAVRRSCGRSRPRRPSRASASSSSIRPIRSAPATCSTREAMKTLVLGGGVVGVTTAYFLAKAGHEVTLVEEKSALGLEATAGNAGIIAPGHSFAWASPRAPRMLWQSLWGAETAIRVRLAPGLPLYTWGLAFLRACTAERARRNTPIKLR